MENQKHNLHVGQTLWLVLSSYYKGNAREPKEVVISKVGRKYFELEGRRLEKYNIDNLREEIDSSYKNQCYLSFQEILDKKEIQKLTDEIRKFLQPYGELDLSLDQLRRISAIISENNEEQ